MKLPIRAVSRASSAILADLDIRGRAISFRTLAHVALSGVSCGFYAECSHHDTDKEVILSCFAQPRIGYSCRTTVRSDLLTLIPPAYSMKPSFLNLVIKIFTRERVVPIISASVS
jgi:hypothetical protein